MAKTALIYLFITIFCAVFGAVYEMYSHEVYSFYMIYAFAIPLIGGTLPYLLLYLSKRRAPGIAVRMIGHAAVATLTVGCIIAGVLEIYGTTSGLVQCYWCVGIALVVLFMVALILDLKSGR